MCSESPTPPWPLGTGTWPGPTTSPMPLTQRRARWNIPSLRPRWMARRELWSPISSLSLFTASIFTAATTRPTRSAAAHPTSCLPEPCLQVCSHRAPALPLLGRDQARGGQALSNQLELHWGMVKKILCSRTNWNYMDFLFRVRDWCVVCTEWCVWVCAGSWRKGEVDCQDN